MPAPGVGAVCGACPNGYTGDGEKCSGRYYFNIDLKNREIVNDSWLRFGVAADSHYPRQRCAGSLTPVLVGINCLTLSRKLALYCLLPYCFV